MTVLSEINEAPVLLIIFNRPETTRIVFEAIRRERPKKLYIAGDGPRTGNINDQINCEMARKITKEIDWECDVQYHFLDENLGCGNGVSSAITWAFDQEDRLIILEDDCVPSIPFFDYCNYLLDKYYDDSRVWLISGRSHHSNTKYFCDTDYIFSRYVHIWGWATWKRCWQTFDLSMKSFPFFMKEGGFINVFSIGKEARFLNAFYKKLYSNKSLPFSTWDFQFGYTVNSNGGLAVIPAKNLIENIGSEGAHTVGINKHCYLKGNDEFIIKKEPNFILPNIEYDTYHFNHHIFKIFAKRTILIRIARKVLKLLQINN